MISSTSIDLPEHRKEVMDACLREGFFPKAMEHLPARDADAVQVSLELVDEAEVYLGIYAWRYGHVPDGYDVSITELELRRAEERGIPILVFVIDRSHALSIEMVEADAAAQAKLERLKRRAASGRVRAEFSSAVDLRGKVIQALADLKAREAKAAGGQPAPSLHPPSDIPRAPARYVAHPYTLLQTADVVGRRDELNLLTDWVTTNRVVPAGTRIFSVVAIGGMGKSALTWKWFEDVAPNELPGLAGRMWWSFYESDAHWENFLIRALAYTAGLTEAAVRAMPWPEREDRLWRVLDERPFLLVLDGLERILLAYARMDAAHMLEDDLDQQTANVIAETYGLPDDVKETYLEKHRLRQCADLRAGAFLRRLASTRASRVLISTRLYPAELQAQTARSLPGCHALFLRGLGDDDALALWRGLIGGERSGTSDQLLALFRTFGNYALLIRALAGEIAEYKPAPGDFSRWLRDHPHFDPARLPLRNAKTHVLEFALRGLGKVQWRLLHTIAAFRMPATYETLRALLVADASAARRGESDEPAPCNDDRTLDLVLTELEDRGLVGWDRLANRYDLHPIVRSVAWAALAPTAKRDIYGRLRGYFDAAPPPPDWTDVNSVDDLTPSVELFSILVGLERFEDAVQVFDRHLKNATLFRLSASRVRLELIEQLFPDGVEMLPRLAEESDQAWALNALAQAYWGRGEPRRATTAWRRAIAIRRRRGEVPELQVVLTNFADGAQACGALRDAAHATSEALASVRGNPGRLSEPTARFHESAILNVHGSTMGLRGDVGHASVALRRSQRIAASRGDRQGEGFALVILAQLALFRRRTTLALRLARTAWTAAHTLRHELDFIRAARVEGAASRDLGDVGSAAARLQYALARARAIDFVEEELQSLASLAELRRQEGLRDEARELLDQIWLPAERGPYPLWHADALNVLAQLERDAGNRDAAIDAATRAHTLAWCDGPPWAYHYGLTNARAHLEALGAPEPFLPPFDESKHEPLPDAALNPDDEYHVDEREADDDVGDGRFRSTS